MIRRFIRGSWLVFSLVACVSTATPSAAPSLPPSASPSPTPPPVPSPAPSDTSVPPLRFAAIGDYGLAGPPLTAVAALLDRWEPDLIITLGDNNYPDGSAATIDQNIGQFFHRYIYPYNGVYGGGAAENRFFPVLGNHDWSSSNAQPYLDYFTLPGNERYYDFVRGPVHFFALDSDWREPDGIGRSSVQALWLQRALAASASPWNVVYFHTPPYSSGPHGSTPAMQWPFQAWGASVVLSGHDHTYERLVVAGLPYLVNGLGGSPNRYPFSEPVEGSLFRYRESHGALLVEALPTRLTFQFVTVNGDVIDSFVLEKD